MKGGYRMKLKSIYDIQLLSANNEENFLEQFKGKVTLIVNTTVGCGNANQLEVLQMLQDKYGGEDFQVVAIPTNDYCGPGVTHGRWSQGITCGLDSQEYGREVYGVTFQFSEMVSSNPNDFANDLSPHKNDINVNGLGQPRKETHELYKEIAEHMIKMSNKEKELGIINKKDYYSYWLNMDTDSGIQQGGNFEKYIVDRDGYVSKWLQCTVLNYDSEKGVKEQAEKEGRRIDVGPGRSRKIFNEEYEVVCGIIEDLIAGKKSIINPVNN
jgi:glutathione peroxidase-family protein